MSTSGTDKWGAVKARMTRLGICDADLRESFIRASGQGGQKVNKTSSCVQLKHTPTGFTVRCQTSRSQERNRLLARQMLCQQIERARQQQRAAARSEKEKARRQKRGLSEGAKRRRIQNRKKRSLQKQLRRKPSLSD